MDKDKCIQSTTNIDEESHGTNDFDLIVDDLEFMELTSTDGSEYFDDEEQLNEETGQYFEIITGDEQEEEIDTVDSDFIISIVLRLDHFVNHELEYFEENSENISKLRTQ